jgi:competence protein ComFC
MWKIGRHIFDFFFPVLPRCVWCGDSYQPYYGLAFCRRCLNRMPLITGPVCLRCNRPLRGGKSDLCGQCRMETLFYEQGMAVAVYEGMMRELLHAAKYHFRPDLARGLGTLLAAWAENEKRLEPVEALIPIPLHSQKLMARGYNQAELIAEPLASALRRPLLTGVLQRVKPTESQSKLRREERKANAEDAFLVIDYAAVLGKKLLLVDDICTTGYTLSAAARTLLFAGAASVQALTVAVGVLEEE